MLKEFVDRILELGKTELMHTGEMTYSPRPLVLVTPPKSASTINLVTLTGLVDAVNAKLDAINTEEWIVIIHSYAGVALVEKATDAYGRRETLLTVDLTDGEAFPFNKFLPREEFVIGLQSRFVQDQTTEDLLRLTSSMEAVAIAEDDGVSQQTTVKQGVALKERVVVKGRRSLRPYRTFREVEQPASEFVFRIRSQGVEMPQCALFEADGRKWSLDAVLAIKAWMESQNLGLPIVA